MCHQLMVTLGAGACVGAGGAGGCVGAGWTGAWVGAGGASVAGAPHAVSAKEAMSSTLKIMQILRDMFFSF
jgi:hypothetical protein